MTNTQDFHIILLRHGESVANASGLLQGQSDWPLTETGVNQAKTLALQWKTNDRQFDLIISSPLIRAQSTAQEIANTLQFPIIYEQDWRERNFGSYEKMSYDDIVNKDGGVDFSHPYETIGGGESLLDLYFRAGRAVQSLIQKPPGNYLVVAHGAILNMALYHILGLSPIGNPKSPRFVFGNTGYVDLMYMPEGQQWRILAFVNHSRQGEEIQGR
jgi:broad specificity phosphatase PhoE